jgi:predicted enzyme related to lactoylglutathione lyase
VVSEEALMSGEVDYFEIGSPDLGASTAFYGGVFGWNVEEPQGPMPYSMVDGGSGGVWDTSAMGGDHYAIFYVNVDDVAATVERAESLGATVVVPVTDNGQILFAHLADPHGNRFGVWHPKQ